MSELRDRLQPHLADRYALERELGKGGMATVFLARDIKHDREVAIKVLHPELSASIGAERFEREIKLAAKLQHPHILGLYDSGQADGLLYYVMPFVKGESLRDLLDREGQLGIEDAIQFILEVADALGHAHSQGIIHRDIKPENVLISNGHALVADFGIASAAQEGGGQKLTQTGMAVGTPVYMSPEQAVGDPVGPTSDLYSLGCMLYELLAGEPPFTAKNSQALMARHAMEAVPSIRIVRNTVPEEVEDAIFAAMAKVPADRPKNAAQFAEMLGTPLGATATRRTSTRSTGTRRVPTGAQRLLERQVPWWRKPWVIGAGVLVLAGGVFAGVKLFGGSGRAPVGAADLARAKRIAVLYFSVDSTDADLRSVGDALTESLIRSLQAVPGLTVVSREGVKPFRGKDAPRDSIGTALDVGTLVEGAIEPEGEDKVRVTTRLFDGSGVPLSDRASLVIPRDSLFAAGESIGERVSSSLRTLLGPEIQLREGQARASNLQAWTLFARAEKSRKDAEVVAGSDSARAAGLLAQADSLLALASQADSRWIDPIVLRGEVAIQNARLDKDRLEKDKWYQAGLRHAEQALKLDPASARALALRGTLRYAQWRLNLGTDPEVRKALLTSAAKDLQDAVNADGTLAAAYATLSSVDYDLKDVPSGLQHARSAYLADRFLGNADLILSRLFWANHDLEQFAEARKYCEIGSARYPRDYRFVECQLWLQLIPNSKQDIPEAWRLAFKVDSVTPPAARAYQSAFARLIVGGIIGKSARPASGGPAEGPLADSARRVIERSQVGVDIDPTQELLGYQAVMWTLMGRYDEAISILKRYMPLNPDHSFQVGGNVHWWWRVLIDKPEFKALTTQRR